MTMKLLNYMIKLTDLLYNCLGIFLLWKVFEIYLKDTVPVP